MTSRTIWTVFIFPVPTTKAYVMHHMQYGSTFLITIQSALFKQFETFAVTQSTFRIFQMFTS